METTNFRYSVLIRFKRRLIVNPYWDISEDVKTFKEAISYKTLIDHTVSEFQIFDKVKNEIVAKIDGLTYQIEQFEKRQN